MFGPHPRHHHHRQRPFGFGFFGPHRRWADDVPPSDWPFGRGNRRWGGFGGLFG